MVRYSKWNRIYLAPDQGAGSGGGNPSANQGGAQAGGSEPTKVADPTAGLNLDDFDPETRKILEAARGGFAALQKQADEAEAKRVAEETTRKKFQSNFDAAQAQLQKITAQKGQDDPRTQRLETLKQILVKRNVPVDQATIQAEIMDEMMSQFGTQLKQEIGAELQPMAGAFVSREAEFAWSTAMQSDRTGAMQIPEVAQQAYTQIQDMVSRGQSVTEGVVKNLVGMALYHHIQNGGQAPQQQQQQQKQSPMFPQVGRLTVPGSGAAPYRPQVSDPNAAKHAVDPATETALQAVYQTWAKGQGGVKAPSLIETNRGGRR